MKDVSIALVGSKALATIPPVVVPKAVAAHILALSVTTFERGVQKGEIPKPRQLSPGRVGWLVRELVEWAESRPASELLPPINPRALKKP